ncbi:MAG: hypothetical protein N2486_08485 [Caloramator sp.]|nr:hypothetical protein [Caloramator sp.]
MKDQEKIIMFKEYMKQNGFDENRIDFNVKVVTTFKNNILDHFDETLDNFDSFTFDEFTDKVNLIDDEFGGREKIPLILNAMLDLTEFLKEYKFIKGGKIAYYKRMFTDVNYYLQKYDMLKGKKSEAKELIKNYLNSDFVKKVIKFIENVYISDFRTMKLIEHFLNDVPIGVSYDNTSINLVKDFLLRIELLEIKNSSIGVTKFGRIVSRLEPEERYAIILSNIFNFEKWVEGEKFFNIRNLFYIIYSIFSFKEEIFLNTNEEDNFFILSKDEFRLNYILRDDLCKLYFETFFVGLGLFEVAAPNSIKKISITNTGKNIFKIVTTDLNITIKNKIEYITSLIKNKKLDEAENEIKNFLLIYGEYPIIWDLWGQIAILNGNYLKAYEFFKHAYETANKKSKLIKSVIYHLVICCKRLKKEEETKIYEAKLAELK